MIGPCIFWTWWIALSRLSFEELSFVASITISTFLGRDLGAGHPLSTSGQPNGIAPRVTRPIFSISFRYFQRRLEAGERGWGIRVSHSDCLSKSHQPQR